MPEITQKRLNELEKKEKVYEKVETIMEEAYACDDQGNLTNPDYDLVSIGENVALAHGWM